jgi:ketosteroid isomerase-like protein
VKDAKGNAVTDKGKFLDTLKKQADGKWKLTVIAFNSDLPVAGAPAPK